MCILSRGPEVNIPPSPRLTRRDGEDLASVMTSSCFSSRRNVGRSGGRRPGLGRSPSPWPWRLALPGRGAGHASRLSGLGRAGPAVDCGQRVTDDDGRRRLLCPPGGTASPTAYAHADPAEVPRSRATASSSWQHAATASRPPAATSAAAASGG